MSGDLALQLDLALRLLVAAALGAAIGFEREIHDQQAGLRTHLLVALGSALFTIVSIYGFASPGPGAATGQVDPSRVAAQIVTGIGFLGAGAIIRQGVTVRGLTTAASLWATAAIGMAMGAGQAAMAMVGAVIVVFSLWPLALVERRIRLRNPRHLEVRLEVARVSAIGPVTSQLAGGRVEIASIATRKLARERYELTLLLLLPEHGHPGRVIDALAALPDVEVVDSSEPRSS